MMGNTWVLIKIMDPWNTENPIQRVYGGALRILASHKFTRCFYNQASLERLL